MNRIFCILLGFWSALAIAQDSVHSAGVSAQRVELPDDGFSMIPPSGWEVLRNVAGASLLFRAPKQEEGLVSFQATIQVMVFQGGRYIDDLTQNEFGNLIVEKFSAASNRVTQYRLRSQQKIQLENGDDAILYYTEFQIDDAQIMQMHILMSSAKKHFILTYTDFAKFFEQDNSRELAVAFTSMHSAVLDSQPPSRYYFPLVAGGSILGLILLGFSIKAFRAYRLKVISEKLEEEDGEDLHTDAESQFYSKYSRTSKRPKKHDEDTDDENEDEYGEAQGDDEEEIRSQSVALPPKVEKPNKAPPRIPSTESSDRDREHAFSESLPVESDVAKLSDILPHDPTEEADAKALKKKGFFSRKEKSKDDEEEDDTWASNDPQSYVSEVSPLPNPPKPQARVAKTRSTAIASMASSQAMTSQVAPLTEDAWNLGEANESFAEEDEDEADDRV